MHAKTEPPLHVAMASVFLDDAFGSLFRKLLHDPSSEVLVGCTSLGLRTSDASRNMYQATRREDG